VRAEVVNDMVASGDLQMLRQTSPDRAASPSPSERDASPGVRRRGVTINPTPSVQTFRPSSPVRSKSGWKPLPPQAKWGSPTRPPALLTPRREDRVQRSPSPPPTPGRTLSPDRSGDEDNAGGAKGQSRPGNPYFPRRKKGQKGKKKGKGRGKGKGKTRPK
jgi:hypothetical protein